MMKKVVTALFTVYSLSSGQIPPEPATPAVVPSDPVNVAPNPAPAPIDPVTPVSPAVVPPAVVPPEPVNPAPIDPVPVTQPLPPQQPAAPIIPPPMPVPPILIEPLPQPIAQPPFGQIFGAFGQICGEPFIDNVCQSAANAASDILLGTPGFTKCEREFDCCPCSSITCGTLLGTGCNTLSIGASGAFGIRDIVINGRREGGNIEVLDLEGAMNSVMTGNNIIKVSSVGEMGLRNAKIDVDIVENFQMQCQAMGSCQAGKFTFTIPGPPAGYACNPAVTFPDFIISEIKCGGQAGCENADISIINKGCGRAVIQQVQCTQLDSCNNAKFNLIGDIEINTCDLGPSGQTAHGLERCFMHLERLLCPDPNSCAGPTPRLLRDPDNGFLLECGGYTSCAGSDITIVVSREPIRGAITEFEGFKFGGVGSGAGATITIRNNQDGQPIIIKLIDCPSQNSCAGLTIFTGTNVIIEQFNCAPGACNQCTYQQDANSPVYACDPKAAFNHNQLPAVPPANPQFVPSNPQNAAPVDPVNPANPVDPANPAPWASPVV